MTTGMMYKVEGENCVAVLGPAEAAAGNSWWTWRVKPEMKPLKRTEKVKGHKRRQCVETIDK